MPKPATTHAAPCHDCGFTLIELLIVLVLVGVLLAVAVPSYLGFKERAAERTAKANIRSASVAMEAYRLDNTGHKNDADGKKKTTGYKGATVAILRAQYDSGLAPTLSIHKGKTKTDQYCLADTQGTQAWSALGPGIKPSSFRNNTKCK